MYLAHLDHNDPYLHVAGPQSVGFMLLDHIYTYNTLDENETEIYYSVLVPDYWVNEECTVEKFFESTNSSCVFDHLHDGHIGSGMTIDFVLTETAQYHNQDRGFYTFPAVCFPLNKGKDVIL